MSPLKSCFGYGLNATSKVYAHTRSPFRGVDGWSSCHESARPGLYVKPCNPTIQWVLDGKRFSTLTQDPVITGSATEEDKPDDDA